MLNCSYMWIFFFRDVFGLVPSSNGEKMCISTGSPVTKLKRGTGLKTYRILSFIVIIITIIIIVIISTSPRSLNWGAGLVIHRDHHHLPPENRSWLALQLLGQFVNVKPIKWMIIVKIIIKWMIIVKMIATGCQKKEDCSRDKQRATKAEVTIVSFLHSWSFFWPLALFNDHQYHINREKSRKLPLPRWLFPACTFHNLNVATQKPKTLQITASNAKKVIWCCHG